jgi:hypothetical protein
MLGGPKCREKECKEMSTAIGVLVEADPGPGILHKLTGVKPRINRSFTVAALIGSVVVSMRLSEPRP